MNYCVYILKSEIENTYYVGYTHDIALRLQHHNDGWTVSTRGKRPWKVVYTESFETKGKAIKREREIKRMKSRAFIERLISHAGGRPDPVVDSP